MEPTTGIEPVNLILTKDVLYQLSYVGSNGRSDGGEGRIRTSVGYANGFTARPLWPLGYLSGIQKHASLELAMGLEPATP
jgi:hypothetical protein